MGKYLRPLGVLTAAAYIASMPSVASFNPSGTSSLEARTTPAQSSQPAVEVIDTLVLNLNGNSPETVQLIHVGPHYNDLHSYTVRIIDGDTAKVEDRKNLTGQPAHVGLGEGERGVIFWQTEGSGTEIYYDPENEMYMHAGVARQPKKKK